MTEKIDVALEKCLRLFESFRCLGYTPDEIYFSTTDVPNHSGDIVIVWIGMTVRHAGHEFSTDVESVVGVDANALTALWQQYGVRWNASEAYRAEVMSRTADSVSSVDLLAAMIGSGIYPRRVTA